MRINKRCEVEPMVCVRNFDERALDAHLGEDVVEVARLGDTDAGVVDAMDLVQIN